MLEPIDVVPEVVDVDVVVIAENENIRHVVEEESSFSCCDGD